VVGVNVNLAVFFAWHGLSEKLIVSHAAAEVVYTRAGV
jgi:hypothetical protein